MNKNQRVRYLEQYRKKLYKELGDMQYGLTNQDLPTATISKPRLSISSWAIAIAVLVISSFTISLVL
jgi:hypothetical protein